RTWTSVPAHACPCVTGSPTAPPPATPSPPTPALGTSPSRSDSTPPSPPPPLTVSISSTTPVYISGTACQTVTWTASVSGGTSPYTYAWTIGGASAGTGSSVSRTYCGSNTNSTQTVNVGLTV